MTVQENAEDILAEAQLINEKRAEEAAMQVQGGLFEDAGEEEQEEEK